MKKRKVIITKLPQAKSGVEVKLDGLRAGLGFNANVMPWPIMAGKMSEPKFETNKTIGPVPRDMANLEAEKDEVAMIPDKGGIPSTFLIGGKRHHSGGTPLFLPSDSFIFSDTAKMRIKDPNILSQFGMAIKKGGYTPAEIAKKYEINDYKKILLDPDTDKLQRDTAELMIANNNLKLAKLAIYQESMKGFPQGMPQVGMPYLEEMGIDPEQFLQQNPGAGQDDTAEADNMSRKGGPVLPKAVLGNNPYASAFNKQMPAFSSISPNAGAAEAYKNAQPTDSSTAPSKLTAQEFSVTSKPKTAWNRIAAVETGLAGTKALTNLFNQDERSALEDYIKTGTSSDMVINAVDANKGKYVQTGMATGAINPMATGNLVQQPGMQYTEAVSKYGGDVDYFAPGGYVPMAKNGYQADPSLGKITEYLQQRQEEARKKEIWNKAYYDALRQQEEKWYADKEKAEEEKLKQAAIAKSDYVKKNELKRRENNIKRLYKELETSRDKVATEANLNRELAEYEAYLNKINLKPAPPKQVSAIPFTEINQTEKQGVVGKPADVTDAGKKAAENLALQQAKEEQKKRFEASMQSQNQPVSQEKKPAAPKQFSGIRTVNIAFKEGGATGKRRVIIHSLGQYKTGGTLPKAKDGDAGKTIKEWVKGSNGRYAPLYTDGTFGPGQDNPPLMIKPYKGADAPSKYSEQDWKAFAEMTGFKPKSETPEAQNLEFQEFLSEHPDFKDEVNRLHTVHGTPTKTGKKFDSLIGKRWDLILEKKPAAKQEPGTTPPVKDDKKKTTVTDKGPYAENFEYPLVPPVPPRFTTRDTLKMGKAAYDLLNAKGFYPFSPKPSFYGIDTTFQSPERQYAAIAENFNTAANALAQFGPASQYNARLAELQGNALKGIADTAAQVEAKNVDIANQRDALNAQMLNDYAQREAARQKQFYDDTIRVSSGIRNYKAHALDAAVNTLGQAIENRANIYNLNQLYPQYAVGPSGMFYFKNPRAIKPDYSQQKTVDEYFNQILKENENLRSEKGMAIAYDMAKSMAGTKSPGSDYDAWTKAARGVIPSYAANVNPYGYTEES